MKIGFFTDSYLPSPDGVATSVESSAKQLSKLGHEVYIIAPNQPHKKDRNNIYRLVSVRIVDKPEIWWALEVPQRSLFKIASLEFDIIHGHSGGPVSFLGWQLSRLHNIPFVETYHTLWRYYRHYFIYPDFFKLWMVKKITAFIGNDWDAVITPSLKAKREILADGVKKPVYVLPNGIDMKRFSTIEKGFLYHTFNIPRDKRILLTVGRLNKEKSLDFIIRAFALVHRSVPNTVLVIVGTGRELDTLQKLAIFHEVEDSVFFVGSVPYADMPNVYADAELFLFASQTETQGMVIIEALASGVPAIAIDDYAISTIIINGKNGYLVEENKEIFAHKIWSVLKDKHLLDKLKHNAKKTVKDYDISFTTKILEQIYDEIIFNFHTTLQNKKRSNFLLGANKHIVKEYTNFKAMVDMLKNTKLK